MSPTHTRKGSRLYRYYVSTDVICGRKGSGSEPLARIPADLIESATVREMLRMVRTPELVMETIRLVRLEEPDVAEAEIVAALDQFSPLWSTLIPAEQARLVRLLVERVVVGAERIAITLRSAGLGQIAQEMLGRETTRRAA
jgi:site-specific DNA recombinase